MVQRLKGLKTSLGLVLLLLLMSCANQPANVATAVPAAAAPNAVIASSSKLLDASNDLTMPSVGQVAPDFQFTLTNGMTTKLSELRGKKVIVNFWATWCEPCREEMPDLDKVRQEYGETLVILAVNKAETVKQINGFSSQIPVGFALVANPDGDIAQRYGTRTVPNSFFINTDGTIGVRALQTMSYVTIKQNVDSLR